MRVLMVSKACIVGIYQRKLEAIAQQEVDLCVLVPPSWKDERGIQPLERLYTTGYTLADIPIRFNGNFHLHHYPTIGHHIRDFQPDIVHIDEEPYNVATWQALYHAKKANAKSLFFSWQNIKRDYVPPFSWGEKWVFNNIDYALVGTDDTGDVMRAKGYQGQMATIPQFGTDSNLFKPADSQTARPFTIGFIARVVPEKGIEVLLRAMTQIQGDWRLRLVSGGSAIDEMKALAQSLNIAEKVEFVGQLPSTDLPSEYHKIDALVLPSLTRPNWKEQFGRVLVEAMASGVPVIGSDSGAIPTVIGDAGLVVPEGNATALAQSIQLLMDNSTLRADLIQKGRERFLSHFTHDSIAKATVAVYHQMLD
jgi:glycosyltransferase involved in cell wall biosynthesis